MRKRNREIFSLSENVQFIYMGIFPHKNICHNLWNISFNIQNYIFFFFCHLAPKFRLHKYLTKFKPKPLNYPVSSTPDSRQSFALSPCLPSWERQALRGNGGPSWLWEEGGRCGQGRPWRRARGAPPFFLSAAFLSLRRFHFCWAQCFVQQVSYSSLNSF